MTFVANRPTGSAVTVPTLQETKPAGVSYTASSALDTAKAAFELSWTNNWTMTTWDFFTKPKGGEPITEDEFNNSIAPYYGIKYKEGMPRQEVDWMIKRKAKQALLYNQSKGTGEGILSSGGFLGGALVDPVGLPLILFGGPGATAKLAAASGNVGKATALASTNTFIKLFAYSAALDVPYGAFRRGIGEEHELEHSLMGLGFNTLFSGVFGVASGFKQGKIATQRRNAFRKYTAFKELMDNSRASGQVTPEQIINAARDSANPKFAQLIESNPRLKDIALGKVKEADLTSQDIAQIQAIAYANESHGLLHNISVALADNYLDTLKRNPTKALRKPWKDYQDRLKRYQEALTTKDTSKLNAADIEFLKQYGAKFDKDNNFKALNSENRVAYEAAYQHSKTKPSASTKTDEIINNFNFHNVKINAKGQRELIKPTPEIEVVNNFLKSEYDALVSFSPAIKIREDMLDITEGIINKYFLGKKSNVKFDREHPLVYHAKYEMAKGAYNYETGEMAIGPGLTKGDTPLRNYPSQVVNTGMHEFVHSLRYIPEASQLQTLANSIAKKDSALDVEITRRGYSVDKLVEERAPILMEWAITKPEFWNTLAKKNPELHSKLADSITKLMEDLRVYLQQDSPVLVNNLDRLQKKTPIAERVAETLQKIKNDSDSVNIFKNIYEYNKQHAGSTVANQMAEPAYNNPNIKARVTELERFNSDPKQYLTDEIITILGDETILPILQSLPKLSKGTKGRKEHIVKVQETLVEKGFDNLGRIYETILLNLQGSASRNAKIAKIIRQNPTSESFIEKLNELQESGTPPEVLSRIGYILLDGNTTPAQKLGKIKTYFEQEDLAMILRFVHNDAIRTSLNTQAKISSGKKARLAQLKTMLDGNLRPDVTRGPSMQTKVRAQIEKDQSPIIDYLAKNDLLELFFGEDQSKYMAQYFGQKTTATGEPLEQASGNLHKDIMKSIMSGEPQGLIKGIPELEGLVDIIKTINRGQLAEINRLGINIRESKNFTGYSVRYDRELVASMPVTDFVNYMLNVVDLAETSRLHGGVMNKFTKGEADGVQPFSARPFFKRMHKEIVDGTFIDDGTTANKSIAGAMRKSSKIAIREQVKPEVLVKFSNFKNLGRLLLDQIRSRSEKIALIKNLGHDPYTMLMDVARDLQVTKTPGFRTFDWTAKQISGMLDNPVDAVFAQNFQKVRGVSNLLYLPTASLSALSDIPLTMTTLDYLGAKVPFSQFMKRYVRAFKMAFKGSDKEMNAWFRAQGAGFDLLTRTIGQRVVTGEPLGKDLTGTGVQTMFELTALNRITSTHQILFVDNVSSQLAIELKAMNKDSVLLARMREFGFTNAELEHLAKHIVETPDGIERSAPSNIPNAKTQAKLQAFYSQYMKEAVMEPDAGAQAMSRLGFEAGTVKGEAARTAFQYSSFMLGMSRVVYRRFSHGYTGEGKHNGLAMSHLIAYLGCAIGFAYITTVLKDVSRGKEPIDITNMSQFDFNRIISQSGILGIGDLAFNAVRFKDPMAFFSPVAGQAVDLATGDLESFIKPFKGEQYPIIGPVMQKAIGFVAGETVNAVQSDLEQILLDTE